MLEIIEYGKDEYTFPCLVVLGCFDAVHTGHRELFKKAKLQSKINGLDLGVMMFRGGKGGKTLYSFEQRIKFLESYNVKFVLAIDYTDDFKKTAPLDFLHVIEDKLNVKAYMSGKDFRFGAGAKGKSSTLKNYAEDEENGVWYMPVKDVMLGSEKISTTLIKSCLDNGDVKKAAELLGENYFVEGEVIKGAGRGAELLGYPTINVAYPEDKYEVKRGVYKIKCTVGETVYDGVANFGARPTFDDNETVLEAHLENCSDDLYGSAVKIEFTEFIRETYKLANAEELKAQLEADIATLYGAEPRLVATPVEETATTEPEVVEEVVVTEPEVIEEVVVTEPEVIEEVVVTEPEVIEEVVATEPEVVEEVVVTEPEVVEEVVATEPEAADGFDEFTVTEEEAANYTVEVVETEEVEAVVEPEEIAETEAEPEETAEEVVYEEPVEEVVEENVCDEPVEEAAEETVCGEPVEEVVEESIYEEPVEYVAETAEEIPEEEIAYTEEETVTEETPYTAEDPVEEPVIEEQPVEEIAAEEETEPVQEEIPDDMAYTEGEEVTAEEEPAQEEINETEVEEPAQEEATEENDD